MGNYLLDVGWYPEYEAAGQFIVQLVKGQDWENPQYKKSCKTCEELERIIQELVVLFEK